MKTDLSQNHSFLRGIILNILITTLNIFHLL